MTPAPRLPDDGFYKKLVETAYSLNLSRSKRKSANTGANDRCIAVRGEELRNVIEARIRDEYSDLIREHDHVPYTFSFWIEKEKNVTIDICVKLEEKEYSGKGTVNYSIAEISRSGAVEFLVRLLD